MTITEYFQSSIASHNYIISWAILYIAGLGTSLTPCIYPIIGISVSVFGANQASSKMQSALLSLCFILGIATLFTPLGLISALSGAGLGRHMGSPWIMVPLAVLFVFMSLSMFGFFNMQLPEPIKKMLLKKSSLGYSGAFFIGLTSGIIAAPCSGPILAVLLSHIATSQDIVLGSSGLFFYSLGFGTLFFLVGTLALRLPKSGIWLIHIKTIFGIIMLFLAFYYIHPWLPLPSKKTLLWIIIPSIMLSFGIVSWFVHVASTSIMKKLQRAMSITLICAGSIGIWIFTNASDQISSIQWHTNYDVAWNKARQEQKPFIVDFAADWCSACKELDKKVLQNTQIIAESKRFIAVRIDLTKSSAPWWSTLRETYQQLALPFIAVHDKYGRVQIKITSLISPKVLLDRLKSVR